MYTETPFSAGLAVSLFQDAIEIMLLAIADNLELIFKSEREKHFHQLVQRIVEKAPKLPYTSVILEINKARVGFKHAGILPDVAHIRTRRDQTLLFLEEATLHFIKTSFTRLSVATFIDDKKIRDELIKAKELLDQEDYQNSLTSSAIAVMLSIQPMEQLLPEFREPEYPYNDNGVDSQVVNDYTQKKAMIENLNLIRNFMIIQMIPSARMSDYLKFRYITPDVEMTFNDDIQTTILRDFDVADIAGNALFASDFAADFCLNAQSKFSSDTFRQDIKFSQ